MRLYDFGTSMLLVLVVVTAFTMVKLAVDEWYADQPIAHYVRDDGPVEEVLEEALEAATGADIDLSPWNPDAEFRDD